MTEFIHWFVAFAIVMSVVGIGIGLIWFLTEKMEMSADEVADALFGAIVGIIFLFLMVWCVKECVFGDPSDTAAPVQAEANK